MKKIILLVIALIMLTGCTSNTENSSDDWTMLIYTDSETCVEYFKNSAGYGGGLSVRYNPDGTIKLNKKCLNDK